MLTFVIKIVYFSPHSHFVHVLFSKPVNNIIDLHSYIKDNVKNLNMSQKCFFHIHFGDNNALALRKWKYFESFYYDRFIVIRIPYTYVYKCIEN